MGSPTGLAQSERGSEKGEAKRGRESKRRSKKTSRDQEVRPQVKSVNSQQLIHLILTGICPKALNISKHLSIRREPAFGSGFLTSYKPLLGPSLDPQNHPTPSNTAPDPFVPSSLWSWSEVPRALDDASFKEKVQHWFEASFSARFRSLARVRSFLPAP